MLANGLNQLGFTWVCRESFNSFEKNSLIWKIGIKSSMYGIGSCSNGLVSKNDRITE